MSQRILHIVHQYMPHHVGGTELYTQTLARYQVEQGHAVAIFCPAPIEASTITMPTDEEGIRVYRFPTNTHNRVNIFFNAFRGRNLQEAFTAVLTQEAPTIIHIQHLMGLPTTLIEAIVAANIPFVITLHDYWYICANAQLIRNDDNTICSGPDARWHNCGRCALARVHAPTLLAPAVAPLMRQRNHRLRRIFQQAQQVIAPTHFVQQTYAQSDLPMENVTILPHGIEVPHEQIEAILAKRPSRHPHAPLHIGYIGSIGWQKGVHSLITAVNNLSHEQTRLTIYGSLDTFPDYVTQLKKSIQHPHIQLAGRVSRQDLWPALADFDVLVLPTLWYEASPLTIDEAFAVRVPIIASHIGAMPEKIQHGIDGLLFPPGDALALQNSLQQLLEDRQQLTQLRQNIQPVYTMAQQVHDIAQVYERAIMSNHVGR